MVHASLVRPPQQVIADAFAQAEARDPGHLRDWTVLVDGATRLRARRRVLLDGRAAAEMAAQAAAERLPAARAARSRRTRRIR